MIALRAISSFIEPPVFEITRRLRTLPPAAGSSNCKTVLPRVRVSLFAFTNRYQRGPSCCSSSCLYSSSVVGKRFGPLPALFAEGGTWQEANPSHKRRLKDKRDFIRGRGMKGEPRSGSYQSQAVGPTFCCAVLHSPLTLPAHVSFSGFSVRGPRRFTHRLHLLRTASRRGVAPPAKGASPPARGRRGGAGPRRRPEAAAVVSHAG